MSENNGNETKPPRKRGITSVMLGWLAERMRRAEDLRQKINTGTYQVESEKIAESLINDSTNK